MGEDRISRLIVEQRNITQLIETLYNEIITLQNSIDERRRALEFLEKFKDIDSDIDILFPLGGGLYLKAYIPKQENIYANVGAQTYLDKSIDDIIPEIKKVIEQLTKMLEERRDALNKLRARYDEITAELAELYFKAGKGTR